MSRPAQGLPARVQGTPVTWSVKWCVTCQCRGPGGAPSRKVPRARGHLYATAHAQPAPVQTRTRRSCSPTRARGETRAGSPGGAPASPSASPRSRYSSCSRSGPGRAWCARSTSGPRAGLTG
eukprot:TRINITY_DN4806_c0_g1::TRINITY_DN4806_c0_g1_i1::g.1000::m.1000 TRINITY_DN4806_c0_g1::TRINITY_DN4806_c0_g1_i1::g.1000  ORF type:complete len:122 (+),score=-21.91,Syntaphilin/PF15290.1/3 TRINITY_DN4806_c0_g1_i1:179-544(+)